MAYATLDDLLATMSVAPADADAQALLDDLLEDASASITEMCGRSFYLSGTETRTFNVVKRNATLLSDALSYPVDIISLSLVELAWQTGDTFSTVASGSNGYSLSPEYPDTGWPYQDILLSNIPTDFLAFPYGQGVVRLTGIFGWPVVPNLVKRATIDLAREWYRQGPGGGGPIGISQLGAPIFSSGSPPTVRQLYKSDYRLRSFSYV